MQAGVVAVIALRRGCTMRLCGLFVSCLVAGAADFFVVVAGMRKGQDSVVLAEIKSLLPFGFLFVKKKRGSQQDASLSSGVRYAAGRPSRRAESVGCVEAEWMGLGRLGSTAQHSSTAAAGNSRFGMETRRVCFEFWAEDQIGCKAVTWCSKPGEKP